MNNVANALVMIGGTASIVWGLGFSTGLPPLAAAAACFFGAAMFMIGAMTWNR